MPVPRGRDRSRAVPAPRMGRGCRATDYGRSSAEVAFQTKPQLALEMIEAALDAGVPAKWVAGDEVYGSDGQLRRALEARDQAYVLAVKSSEHSTTWPPYGPPGHVTAATVAAAEPDQWQRLRCDEGAQGERWYDWLCGRYGPRCARGGCTHCWSAAIPSGPTSAPSTGAIARPTPHWKTSSARSAPAGRLRRCSNRPQGRWASTSMRCTPGGAGIVTPPWHSWRSRC